MLERIYKRNGLDHRLAKMASSTNRSRDRSSADDPNRPSLKDQERQAKRARHRLHSAKTAQTMYAQDTIWGSMHLKSQAMNALQLLIILRIPFTIRVMSVDSASVYILLSRCALQGGNQEAV